MKAYHLPFENLKNGYYLAKDTFLLNGDDICAVYQKEECLLQDPAVSWWFDGDSTVVCSSDRHNIIFRRKSGEILYQSQVPENLVRTLGELQLMSRGNYLCLMNGEGQCVLKVVEGNMGG